MSNFIKYFRENKKKLLNIIILSIIPIYIIFSMIFPTISIKFSASSIWQILMVLVTFYFAINIKKLKIQEIKKLVKKYRKFMNKNILVRAITILIAIFLLKDILNVVLNMKEIETSSNYILQNQSIIKQ